MGYKPQKTSVTIKRRIVRSRRKGASADTPRDKYGKTVWVGDVLVNPRLVPLPDGEYIPQLFSHTVDRVIDGDRCFFLEYPDEYGPFDTRKFVRVLRSTEP